MQFLTPSQLIDRRFIEIGINVYTKKPYKVADYYLGDAWLCCGMTGYGKTMLVGNFIVTFSKHRPIIIFDYKGDYRNLKNPNWTSRDGIYDCISDLVYIHKFGFKLQDFTNAFEWELMGMTKNGANLCASKAKEILYHQNDFDKFIDMIGDVPAFGKNKETWQSTKDSVISKLRGIKSAFIQGNKCVDITDADLNRISYMGVPYYISDWKKFIKKHGHICLNMNSEFAPAKARLMVGKILNDIEPIMQQLNPVIAIEEAHELCPNSYDDDLPYSMIKILHYLKELHKKGVKMILITQYPSQLNDSALDEIKRFFIGKLQNIKGNSRLDEMFKLSSNLQYNMINDYREFLHYSPLYNERGVFVPYDSYTYYEKRK